MVKLGGDIAGQFHMLFLILAHRHMRGVIQQNIGGHQRRISIQAERLLFRIRPRLFLELGHPVHPAQPGDAVENPAQFGMRRYLGLVEQDGFIWVNSGGQKPCGHLSGRRAQIGGVLPYGDGMHVNDAIDRLKCRALHAHEPLDCAQIIAQRQTARRLDAGKDTGGKFCVAHVAVSLENRTCFA